MGEARDSTWVPNVMQVNSASALNHLSTACNSPPLFGSKSPLNHNYLLIKNLPNAITPQKLLEILPTKCKFEDIIKVPESNNIYVSFKSLEEIRQIVEASEQNPINYNGKQLRMCLVNKLPLDLNNSSSILLLTIYHEKVEINIYTLSSLFQNYGPIQKMIIFKKKNFQTFIEFESSDDAAFFKQALNGQNFFGYFSLKIQFTQKHSLIVNANTDLECDFRMINNCFGLKPPVNFKNQNQPVFYRNYHSEVQSLEDLPSSESKVLSLLAKKSRLEAEKHLSYEPEKKAPSCIRKILFDDEEESDIRLAEAFLNYEAESEHEGISTIRTQPQLESVCLGKSKESSIARVTNLSSEVKHKYLFNLFSLYGTIEQIYIDQISALGLICFSSEFEAITASYYLNGINLFGKTISVEAVKDGPKQWDRNKTVLYTPKTLANDLQSKQRTINKPCAILYVFNLSKVVDLNFVMKLIETKERVKSINYLNSSKNSALCFMESVESAVRALCLFKNVNLLDKSLKINFANESLVKAKAKPGLSFSPNSPESRD